MISEKMMDLLSTNSQIRAMFDEGRALTAKYGAENVYDFSLGNPCAQPPESVRNAAMQLLGGALDVQLHGLSLDTSCASDTQELHNLAPNAFLHGYMNNSGHEDVREALAVHIGREHGISLNKNNIAMTSGAAGAMNVILKTILNPGDEVIIFAPFFPEYRIYALNFDGVPVIVPPQMNGFGLNFAALEPLLTAKTKAVIINSPNNPTGAIYSAAELSRLGDILETKQHEFGTSIYLISDEPYREIVFDGNHVPYVPKYYSNTFVAYSYSKSLSLPGERIGYIVMPDSLDDFQQIVGAVNVANRILGFVNAPSLFQKVIACVLGETSDISLYAKNMDVLYHALVGFGYDCFKPKGAFYLFCKCPENLPSDTDFCNAAKKYRVLVVPGSAFGCPGYFRVALCVKHETVLGALEAFESLAKK